MVSDAEPRHHRRSPRCASCYSDALALNLTTSPHEFLEFVWLERRFCFAFLQVIPSSNHAKIFELSMPSVDLS